MYVFNFKLFLIVFIVCKCFHVEDEWNINLKICNGALLLEDHESSCSINMFQLISMS